MPSAANLSVTVDGSIRSSKMLLGSLTTPFSKSTTSITSHTTKTPTKASTPTTSMPFQSLEVGRYNPISRTHCHLGIHPGRFIPTRRTPGVSTSELLERMVVGYRHGDWDPKLEKMGHPELKSRQGSPL